MSRFHAEIARTTNHTLDVTFSESITIAPLSGGSIETSGRVDVESTDTGDGDVGALVERFATINVAVGAYVSPVRGDVITARGSAWKVDIIPPAAVAERWQLGCVEQTDEEITGTEMRRNVR